MAQMRGNDREAEAIPPMNTAAPKSDLNQLLHKHFGFREFLDGQRRVIDTIIEGRDSLVIMPTGGGKSLCYQFPALIKDGVTLVISPLIALMKDQVDALLQYVKTKEDRKGFIHHYFGLDSEG